MYPTNYSSQYYATNDQGIGSNANYQYTQPIHQYSSLPNQAYFQSPTFSNSQQPSLIGQPNHFQSNTFTNQVQGQFQIPTNSQAYCPQNVLPPSSTHHQSQPNARRPHKSYLRSKNYANKKMNELKRENLNLKWELEKAKEQMAHFQERTIKTLEELNQVRNQLSQALENNRQQR